MISKELENKKKEYYKLYDRFVKADNWFKTQDNDYFENANGSILVNKVNNDSAFLLILNNSNKTVYNCTVITSTGELTTIAPLYSHLSVRTVKSTTRPTVDIWRGYMVYDDDLQKPIWYSGNGVWKNANGDIV